MPEEPALIVDPEELEPYDEPYIESDNELVVIYDPRRVIPYASDRKNFRAVEASLEHAKKKSAARKNLTSCAPSFHCWNSKASFL